jgi:hypothetical protein
MRIIFLSVISWLVLICIAVVVILAVMAIVKITREAINKTGIIREKSIVIGITISGISIIGLSLFMLNYFVWKGPTNKIPESKPLKTPLQREEPIEEIQPKIPLPFKEPVLTETFTEQIQSQTLAPHEEVISQSEERKPIENKKDKLLQHTKPSKTIFTIQVGAFSDFSNAKSLKAMLNKKGYNAFVTFPSRKEGRLYKVSIGKFNDRKKAESLCEKIKKTEGFQAFITLM